MFLTIFRRFPATFRRSPKIVQHLSEGHMNVAEHFPKNCWRFPKVSEDFQKLLKTFEEDPRMFQSYTNDFKYNLRDKLDISEIINIFPSEDMENTPPESRMWFHMNFTSGVFSSKTYDLCLYNKHLYNHCIFDKFYCVTMHKCIT